MRTNDTLNIGERHGAAPSYLPGIPDLLVMKLTCPGLLH